MVFSAAQEKEPGGGREEIEKCPTPVTVPPIVGENKGRAGGVRKIQQG
jgi:hypothetical protein